MNEREHGEELTKFEDFQPTAWDAKGLGSEGQEDWRVVPCAINRDSGVLERSNFETAKKLLEEAKAVFEVHRFGHWGPGWFEIIVVEPTEEGLTAAGRIACKLADHPVLDEDDLGEREYAAVQESWDNWQKDQFLSYIRDRVSDLVYELIYEFDEVLLDAVSNDRAYDYDNGDPSYDATPEELFGTRDKLVALVRAARKAKAAYDAERSSSSA